MNEFINVLISGLVAAIVTGVLNVWNTNKTIHAQVVSKARHEWIQEVRNLISEYISEIEHLKYNINMEYQTNGNKFSLPIINQSNKKFKSLTILKNKIFLHFGQTKTYRTWYLKKVTKNDEDNIHFNKLVDNVNDNMESYINLVFELINSRSVSEKEMDLAYDKVTMDLSLLNGEASNYLKSEWYKTKKMK
ncbi:MULTISPECIES: hypothetical protein [unclassified Staphylococcus]|uniref:hypothetical protein n=1 Tax=unclassified Staphylococcus TaxID=91994 RepID=UPI001AEBF9B0|nr:MULTISPECIES: hypothetical protein [unclassified Staphylococcus]